MHLNYKCNRRVSEKASTLIKSRTDGGRSRRTDFLGEVCRAVTAYLRHVSKMAKNSPHLYGPHAARYCHDTEQAEAREKKIEIALDKVYGPESGASPKLPDIWTRRYKLDPQWKGFRSWYRETYGA